MTSEQLYLDLKHKVLRGDYAPNMKLPSVRSLASKNNVGTATVSRVLAHLEREGLVKVRHGKGVFVSQIESCKEKALTIVMLYFCKDEVSFSPHTSPFGMSCLQVCRRFCIEHNYTFIHRPLFPDVESIRQTIDEFCSNEEVGGFIVLYAGNDYFREYAKVLSESRKPVVFIDNPWRGRHDFNYVTGDDLQLGLLAARYLYELGHRRIAYIMWDVARCFRDELLGFRTELIREGECLDEDKIFRVHNLEE
jgi:DNA-binding LacI/PurR family transcriptional regulator